MNKEKEKKEVFEPPKGVDIEGKEISEERLEKEELDSVAGGVISQVPIPGHLCPAGG